LYHFNDKLTGVNLLPDTDILSEIVCDSQGWKITKKYYLCILASLRFSLWRTCDIPFSKCE